VFEEIKLVKSKISLYLKTNRFVSD